MNRSSSTRRALTVQYCQPWFRQIENQILAVSPDKLDQIPKRITEMMGYNICPPFMGNVDGLHPRKAVDKWVEAVKHSSQKLEAKL